MRKKVLVVALALILIVGLLIAYSYYSFKCDIYNQELVDFTIELLKGNVSYDDIKEQDFPEQIVEACLNYYSKKFYGEEDLILVFSHKDYYDSFYHEIKEFYDSGHEYRNLFDLPSKFDTVREYYFFESYDSLTDEELLLVQEMSLYLGYSGVTTNYSYIVKDNNLYVKAIDMQFEDGICTLNYNGFSRVIPKSSLEKNIRSCLQANDAIQSLPIKLVSKSSDLDMYSLGSLGTFSFEKQFGKYVAVNF